MSLSNPVINFEIKSAVQKAQIEAQKILVFGQITAAGTATPTVVINDIGDDYETLLGANSMAAASVRAINKAAKVVNENLRIDVLPLADGAAAVAAEGGVTYLGTAATASGTLTIAVGSELNHFYSVLVAIGDTPTDIAAAMAAAITADTRAPVTATSAIALLELLAVNKGIEGNFISIKLGGTVAGITAEVTQVMAAGTGDPDAITDKTAFAAISNEIRYQGFVYPGTYASSAKYDGLQEFLDARFPVYNRILDGHAFIGHTLDFSTIKTLASDVNNKAITLFANKPTAIATRLEGGAIVELNYVVSAYFAAIRALRLTDGAQISPYIVGAAGSLDDVGSMSLASLPYMNTPFTGLLPVADINDFWTDEESKEFVDSGVSVVGNNPANNDVIAGQIVTTYLLDALQESDITYKYLNYFDTLVNIREYIFNNFKRRFAQSRLVEGDVVPYRNDANVDTVIGYLLNLYQDLADAALVEKGRDAVKFFGDNLKVTIDKATGTVTVLMLVSPVTQLRTINFTMQVVFSINL